VYVSHAFRTDTTCLLSLRVTQANNVEIRRRAIDEEVRADRLGRLLDHAECLGAGGRVIDHCARGVEELCDGADGGWCSSEVCAAGVVLCALAEGHHYECEVCGRWCERVRRL
jgi:hypothetical protein